MEFLIEKLTEMKSKMIKVETHHIIYTCGDHVLRANFGYFSPETSI